MQLPLDKLAPRAIALAVVGYCVWPCLTAFTSRPAAKPPEKLPELAATLLKPALAPFPARNPFERKHAAVAASVKRGKPSPAAANKTAGKATGRVATKAVDPLSALSLDATCIVGGRRLAMINGRLYATQEKLGAGNSSTPPYKIVGVLPYKVLLELEGKNVELTYSNLASRPASSRRAGGATRPGGAGASRAKSGGSNKSSKTSK
jgi:hypothetical protein